MLCQSSSYHWESMKWPFTANQKQIFNTEENHSKTTVARSGGKFGPFSVTTFSRMRFYLDLTDTLPIVMSTTESICVYLYLFNQLLFTVFILVTLMRIYIQRSSCNHPNCGAHSCQEPTGLASTNKLPTPKWDFRCFYTDCHVWFQAIRMCSCITTKASVEFWDGCPILVLNGNISWCNA